MELLVLILLAATSAWASQGPGLDHFLNLVKQNLQEVSKWPTMVSNYEMFAGLVKEGRGTPLNLEALQLEIQKTTNGPNRIDAYHLGWSWHPAFVSCQSEYQQLEEQAVRTLKSSAALDPQQLESFLMGFKCVDVRPMGDRVLEVISALIDVFERDTAAKTGTMAAQMETIIDHYFPPGAPKPSPMVTTI